MTDCILHFGLNQLCNDPPIVLKTLGQGPRGRFHLAGTDQIQVARATVGRWIGRGRRSGHGRRSAALTVLCQCVFNRLRLGVVRITAQGFIDESFGALKVAGRRSLLCQFAQSAHTRADLLADIGQTCLAQQRQSNAAVDPGKLDQGF